jgi:hypothetical protein
MIIEFLIDITVKFKKYTCYAHNFSSFDSLYLIELLYQKYKCKLLLKNSKIYSVNISNKNLNKEEKKR